MKFYDAETNEQVSIGTISGFQTLTVDVWYYTKSKPKCKDTERSFQLRQPEITFDDNTMCITGYLNIDNENNFKLKSIELRTIKKQKRKKLQIQEKIEGAKTW